LAQRALQGEDDAFALLMSRHKAWAYQFVRRYVGNSSDAYDVLQETFFAAWRSLRQYQQDRPFEFWLRRIALNKCRDCKRRETVRRLFGRASREEAVDVTDPAPGPAERAEGDQELRQLELHISKLPRALQEALLLTTLEGLSQKQAAELLGVSAKAIETRIYRARAQLTQLHGKTREP
jgi:RNA polymerase sigma factor (sigma-70 family)